MVTSDGHPGDGPTPARRGVIAENGAGDELDSRKLMEDLARELTGDRPRRRVVERVRLLLQQWRRK